MSREIRASITLAACVGGGAEVKVTPPPEAVKCRLKRIREEKCGLKIIRMDKKENAQEISKRQEIEM